MRMKTYTMHVDLARFYHIDRIFADPNCVGPYALLTYTDCLAKHCKFGIAFAHVVLNSPYAYYVCVPTPLCVL